MPTRRQHRRLMDDVVKRVPPEIYLMIVEHFRFSEGYRRRDESGPLSTCDFLPYHFYGKPDIHTLRNLRLVTKAFSAAATIVFFEQNCISLLRSYPNCHKRGMHGGPSDIEIASISLSVKNLKVHFPFPRNEDFRDSQWSDKDSAEEHLSWKLSSDFSRVLPQFKNLRFLSYGIGRWHNTWSKGPPRTDLPFTRNLLEPISSPLGEDSFTCLIALKLHLPSTHAFNMAFSALGSKALGRLRHLYVEIKGQTGGRGLPLQDDEYGAPMSNYLQRHPIKEYTPEFLGWIGMCTRLESLSITVHYTQLLDTTELKWKPAGEGLKMLDLYGVIATPTALMDLMSNSEGRPSPVASKVSLINIWLTSGTWDQVIKHMDGLSALMYFCPVNLSYSKKGTSGHLHRSICANLYSPICSMHSVDNNELLRLYLKLDGLARAAGLKYPVDRGENGIVAGILTMTNALGRHRPPFHIDWV